MMAQPIETISLRSLESVRVIFSGRTYQARIQGSRVIVAGKTCAWATVTGDEVHLTLGAKVPDLLRAEIAPGEQEKALAAAVLVAAIAGHPRRDPRGRPIRFIWTDHVALGARRNAQLAMRHTWVDTPQAEHLKELDRTLRVEWVEE